MEIQHQTGAYKYKVSPRLVLDSLDGREIFLEVKANTAVILHVWQRDLTQNGKKISVQTARCGLTVKFFTKMSLTALSVLKMRINV